MDNSHDSNKPVAWLVYAKGTRKYFTLTFDVEKVPEIYKGGEAVPLYASPSARDPEQQAPVAWLDGPYGTVRTNPLHKISAPQSIAWSLPLYINPPRRNPLTHELLRKMHHEDQFGLFCDYDEFEQIARAIESAHGIGEKK